MGTLTAEQLERIKAVLVDGSRALAYVTTGYVLTGDEILRLVKAGYLKTEDVDNIISGAFHAGAVSSRMAEAVTMTAAEFEAHLKVNPLALSDTEQVALDEAKERAGMYCVGLGNRWSDELGRVVIDADADLAREKREIIGDATAEAVAKRRSAKQLRSDLRQLTEDWSRDWDRIAHTELQRAYEHGYAEGTIEQYGDGELLAKVPEPDACAECMRLYTDGERPIVKPARWWMANGTNVGRKKDQWQATIDPLHPNCRCRLQRVPRGWTINMDGEIEPPEVEKAFSKADKPQLGLFDRPTHGPYIGPKGGKWKDPQHTEHWEPPEPPKESGKKERAISERVADFHNRVDLSKPPTLIKVRDLRPIDWESGKRVPLEAGQEATCHRCGAAHIIVWTLQVHTRDGNVTQVDVGSGCAQKAFAGWEPTKDQLSAAKKRGKTEEKEKIQNQIDAWRTQVKKRLEQLTPPEPEYVGSGKRKSYYLMPEEIWRIGDVEIGFHYDEDAPANKRGARTNDDLRRIETQWLVARQTEIFDELGIPASTRLRGQIEMASRVAWERNDRRQTNVMAKLRADKYRPLEKGGLPAGTVHAWADGRRYQKQSDGTWQQLTEHSETPERTGAIKVDPVVVRATVDDLLGDQKWNRHGVLAADLETRDRSVQATTAKGREIQVRVIMLQKPDVTDPRGVSGQHQLIRTVDDPGRQRHLVWLNVRSGVNWDRDELSATLRSVLSHELAHAADPSISEGRPTSTRQIRDTGGEAAYYNDPAEVAARMQQIWREITDRRAVASIEQIRTEAKEEGADFEPDAFSHLHTSDTWNRIEEHLTTENRRRILRMAARAWELIRQGEIDPSFVKSYKLAGRMKWNGFDISVEQDVGDVRHWHNPFNGKDGQTKFKVPYGYLRRTEGVDGDHVDVFVGPHENAPNVYVVHQVRAPDFLQYDEDKVMLGFDSETSARDMYLAHYDDPRFLGSVTTMTLDDFRRKVLRTPDLAPHDRILKSLIERGRELFKAGGPYIGPRGGRWADPEHTIPWHESREGFERQHAARKKKREERLAAHREKIKLGGEYKTETGYVVVIPDASDPGKVRTQSFDEHGFSGHHTYNNLDDLAFDTLPYRGQWEPASGILEKLFGTETWREGMARTTVVMALNSLGYYGKREDQNLINQHIQRHGYQSAADALRGWSENKKELSETTRHLLAKAAADWELSKATLGGIALPQHLGPKAPVGSGTWATDKTKRWGASAVLDSQNVLDNVRQMRDERKIKPRLVLDLRKLNPIVADDLHNVKDLEIDDESMEGIRGDVENDNAKRSRQRALDKRKQAVDNQTVGRKATEWRRPDET